MLTLICTWFLHNCGATPPYNPNVDYRQQAIQQFDLTYEQVSDIRLQCVQQDQVTQVLEIVDQKHKGDLRYHSMVRSKIWQLRTYCQGNQTNQTSPGLDYIGTAATVGPSYTVPERRGCVVQSYKEDANSQVRARIEETCVEQSAIRVRSVQIGDVVRDTEVGVHPVITQNFMYKANTCRWFFEPGVSRNNGDLVAGQGIICQVQPLVWRVIDKF